LLSRPRTDPAHRTAFNEGVELFLHVVHASRVPFFSPSAGLNLFFLIPMNLLKYITDIESTPFLTAPLVPSIFDGPPPGLLLCLDDLSSSPRHRFLCNVQYPPLIAGFPFGQCVLSWRTSPPARDDLKMDQGCFPPGFLACFVFLKEFDWSER